MTARQAKMTACISFVVVLLMPRAVAAQDSREALEFPAGQTLAVVTGTDPSTALVAVTNHGAARADLKFSLLLKTGSDPGEGVTVAADSSNIAAESTAWFKLTITSTDPSKKFEGYLIVSASGAESATLGISIARDTSHAIVFPAGAAKGVTIPIPGGPGGVILIGAIASLVLVGGRFRSKRYDLTKPMGDRKWKFGDSWASTFTGVGALFGTVLGASLLPDTPTLLGKVQFSALNVLFAGTILIAAFVFDAFRDPKGRGRPRLFFIGAFLTFAAVFGELITLGLLVLDSADNVGSPVLSGTFTLIVVLGTVLMARFGWIAIDEAYKAGTKPASSGGKVNRGLVPTEVLFAPDQSDLEDVPLDWVMP
jgi:hypothetical protein